MMVTTFYTGIFLHMLSKYLYVYHQLANELCIGNFSWYVRWPKAIDLSIGGYEIYSYLI